MCTSAHFQRTEVASRDFLPLNTMLLNCCACVVFVGCLLLKSFFASVFRNTSNSAAVSLFNFCLACVIHTHKTALSSPLNQFQAFAVKCMFLFCIVSVVSYLRVATESLADLIQITCHFLYLYSLDGIHRCYCCRARGLGRDASQPTTV